MSGIKQLQDLVGYFESSPELLSDGQMDRWREDRQVVTLGTLRQEDCHELGPAWVIRRDPPVSRDQSNKRISVQTSNSEPGG